MGNAGTRSERRFKVYVKTKAGKTIQAEVKGNDTVEVLKSQIQAKEGIPPDQMRLVFKGRRLEDDQLLSAYRIQNESIILLAQSKEDLTNF